MTTDDIHHWLARDIAAAVRGRSLSATDVAQAMCARIARLEPQINAFASFDAAVPLAAAKDVDRRLAAGEDLPLAGVPFTVKDNLWLGGRPATFGSRVFADFVAPRDAWCVARLRQLGAVPLGVTNCSEFACKGNTDTPLHGETRNPQTHDSSPCKGDPQRLGKRGLGRLSGSDICLGCDLHSEEPGKSREKASDHKTNNNQQT